MKNNLSSNFNSLLYECKGWFISVTITDARCSYRTHYLREKSYTHKATMLYVRLNLFFCIVKLTYVSCNFSVLQVSKRSLSYLIVLKIHLMLTKLYKITHLQQMFVSPFIKWKKDLIQKINMQSDRKITKTIYYFSMLTEWLFH